MADNQKATLIMCKAGLDEKINLKQNKMLFFLFTFESLIFVKLSLVWHKAKI